MAELDVNCTGKFVLDGPGEMIPAPAFFKTAHDTGYRSSLLEFPAERAVLIAATTIEKNKATGLKELTVNITDRQRAGNPAKERVSHGLVLDHPYSLVGRSVKLLQNVTNANLKLKDSTQVERQVIYLDLDCAVSDDQK